MANQNQVDSPKRASIHVTLQGLGRHSMHTCNKKIKARRKERVRSREGGGGEVGRVLWMAVCIFCSLKRGLDHALR